MGRRGRGKPRVRKGLIIVIDDVVKLIEGDSVLYKGRSIKPVFEKIGVDLEELVFGKVRR